MKYDIGDNWTTQEGKIKVDSYHTIDKNKKSKYMKYLDIKSRKQTEETNRIFCDLQQEGVEFLKTYQH